MRRIPGRTRALRAAAALLVSLLCAAPLTAARAAGEVALTVDTAQAAAAGEQVALSVHAADALTVDSLQFRINYDAAALRLVDEPAVGEALAGGIAISNTETAGVVGFAFACADGLSADGTLVTLTFEVLSQTGSAVVLTDVLATTVDAARVQHKAYVTLQIGGVAGGEKGQSLIEIRREVGLVFQYPEYQLFEETVEKDVGFGPRNLDLDEEEVRARARSALAQVGLGEEVMDKSPFELSGGQKRRVAIAGVLAMKPGTLVLDEPVAGLDPAGREELLTLIRGIHESGVTVVMVTHSMDDAARLCGRLIVLDHGEVAFDAAPGDVFRHEEALRAMGLDVPECVKLARALRERGMELGDGLYRMEDVRAAILREVRGC